MSWPINQIVNSPSSYKGRTLQKTNCLSNLAMLDQEQYIYSSLPDNNMKKVYCISTDKAVLAAVAHLSTADIPVNLEKKKCLGHYYYLFNKK